MRRFILAILVLLAACGGEKGKPGGGAADKNHLVIAAMSSPTNLDSRVGNDNVSGRMFDLIYSGLVRVTPNMDYAPDVAETCETPDEHTIIFKLKEANAGIFDNLTLGILPTGADTNTYKTKPVGCGPYKV